jgi:hypothetical protein
MIETGQYVTLKPEWCDCESESLVKKLVISGEEIGKPRITIRHICGFTIEPTELAQVYLVNVEEAHCIHQNDFNNIHFILSNLVL